jgi:ATP-dependent Lhr-like helicase
MCENERVPNEFWPHHGSLSKDIRAETEAALKQRERPASAICTNTLELGIDIGAVKCVAQIDCPPSVASLRQRLGRSGRRKGESAILRGYCIENAINNKPLLGTELRLNTVQMVAMISLLLDGWFEPPMAHGAHLSTLVQQTLSYIAQNGGASIGQLYGLLCGAGTPFENTSKGEFVQLVRHLGQKELLVQDSGGNLLHGPLGEKFVNHYTFYAAFATDEEFRIINGGKTLGTLPVSQMLTVGQRILFAGKTWRVEEVDDEQKVIHVSRARGGLPPLFTGAGGRTHSRIRQRMKEIYESEDVPTYLDETARRFLHEGRKNYRMKDLSQAFVLDQGHELLLLTWLGDSTNEALAALLQQRHYLAVATGPGVEVTKAGRTVDEILALLKEVGSVPAPSLEEMLTGAKNLLRQKWDWALPEPLLLRTYASLNLDVDEALLWARSVAAGGAHDLEARDRHDKSTMTGGPS